MKSSLGIIRRYIVHYTLWANILLILVLAESIMGCASKTPEDTQQLSNPPSTPLQSRYVEEKPPQDFFWQQANQYLFIKNRSIIEQFAKYFGVDNPLIVALIQSINISIQDDAFLLVAKGDSSTSFREKRTLMNLLKGTPTDEERFWEYHKETSLYFDIGYEHIIVISNVNLQKQDIPIGWSPPDLLRVFQEKEDTDMWGWGNTDAFTDTFELNTLDAKWVAMVISDYMPKQDVTLSFIIDYYGNRSVRTTIRLLIPMLIKSMGADTLSSLPNVEFTDDLLIIEGIIISEDAFWDYFLLKDSENDSNN